MKKKKETRGRKSILTPELQNEIVKLLETGCDQKTACSIAGIGERTYHEWKENGREGIETYASFFDAASRARNRYKSALLKIVYAAAYGTLPRHADWKAAAWLLEKGWPREYNVKAVELPQPEEANLKPLTVAIIHNGKPLDELLNFPTKGDLSTPSPEVNGEDDATEPF